MHQATDNTSPTTFPFPIITLTIAKKAAFAASTSRIYLTWTLYCRLENQQPSAPRFAPNKLHAPYPVQYEAQSCL